MLPHDEAYLMHHGTLGMHWGIRKPKDLKGKSNSSEQEKQYDKKFSEIKKNLKSQGVSENALREKYGDDDSNHFLEFVKQHKKGIAIGAGVVVGSAILAASFYADRHDLVSDLTNLRAGLQGADGLALNWDKGVNLPAGSIIKRVSAVPEGVPRPDGFFGAFLDGDVESYKGILPGYFNSWGVGEAKLGGFVNSYKSSVPIVAPSGKESVELFKEFAQKQTPGSKNIVLTGKILGDPLSLLREGAGNPTTEEGWRKAFKGSTVVWANLKAGSAPDAIPGRTEYLDFLRGKGYNAMIDFNDAGKLAKTPVRILDGTQFTVVKNDALSPDEILKAAMHWTPELVHCAKGVNSIKTWDANLFVKNIL